MKTKADNVKWEVSATHGATKMDIDNFFIRGLSDIELLHFYLEIKRALNKCNNERARRGI